MPSAFEGIGDRPWGWWLRANGSVIEDGDGGRWPSVLDAFWHGRLNMPKSNFAKEQLELMLRVMAAIERRPLRPAETHHDMFEGNFAFNRLYMLWLVSVGLAECEGRSSPLDAYLTDFGRSVLLLLQVTREPEWVDLPFTSVSALAFRREGDAAREASLRSFEHEVALRTYVFARERMQGDPSVTLTGMVEEGRVPIRRVIWSQKFPNPLARDDFFAWLAERVDRWDDWGTMAFRRGAGALTQHLFVMLDSPEN
ncbi:MAG: hypothetical protein EOO76_02855 [Novosphingobium sp.]|nr:MAG: hypothetical protein EOO76_02855 [Novosphingobium sp.]